jgi:hypothetical protein
VLQAAALLEATKRCAYEALAERGVEPSRVVQVTLSAGAQAPREALDYRHTSRSDAVDVRLPSCCGDASLDSAMRQGRLSQPRSRCAVRTSAWPHTASWCEHARASSRVKGGLPTSSGGREDPPDAVGTNHM